LKDTAEFLKVVLEYQSPRKKKERGGEKNSSP
jgi:hypothetical protein